MFKHTLRRRARDESGANAVEFALLAPIVFMILFGTITGGWSWNAQQTLTHAARDGARFGATLPVQGDIDAWKAAVEERTRDAATGLDPTKVDVDVDETCLNADPDDPRVCVAVSYPVEIVTVFLPNWPIELQADAIARHEPREEE